jgi:hypothetical protein
MTLEELLAEAGITEMEIMAYADGVLAPERRPVVRAALTKYPELMQLLESFLFTRGPLVEAYDEVLDAPVPETLLRPFQPPAQPPAPRRRRLAFLKDMLFGSPAGGFRRTAFALAAISTAVFAAWLLLSRSVGYDFATFGERGFVASPALQRALDETPMGKSARIGGGLSIIPQLTFSRRHEIWCREFEVVFGGGKHAGALACRRDDGAWSVGVGTEAERVDASPGEHTPAVRKSEILDGARRGIKDSNDMLSIEEEDGAIKDGWKRKPSKPREVDPPGQRQ